METSKIPDPINDPTVEIEKPGEDEALEIINKSSRLKQNIRVLALIIAGVGVSVYGVNEIIKLKFDQRWDDHQTVFGKSTDTGYLPEETRKDIQRMIDLFDKYKACRTTQDYQKLFDEAVEKNDANIQHACLYHLFELCTNAEDYKKVYASASMKQVHDLDIQKMCLGRIAETSTDVTELKRVIDNGLKLNDGNSVAKAFQKFTSTPNITFNDLSWAYERLDQPVPTVIPDTINGIAAEGIGHIEDKDNRLFQPGFLKKAQELATTPEQRQWFEAKRKERESYKRIK